MSDLANTLAALAAMRSKFETLLAAAGAGFPAGAATFAASASCLHEITGFGTNPGDLRMLVYAPEQLPPDPALVVAMHGCGQTAAAFNQGTGWADLADRHGFVVVFPEQRQANNPNTCFSWFMPGDIGRNGGEAHSIQQMVERAITTFAVDRRRVFATGLSAGGAMTSVMLATYPEIFAGGAIIAGLPYGCARNVQEALEAMLSQQSPSALLLGDRVRTASRHQGPWPRISVWHGSADATVKPSNAEHIVSQWADVHGLADAPTSTQAIGRHTHRVWSDAEGNAAIEAFNIAGMGHGVPLDVSSGAGACGVAGPFFLDVGLSSTEHIAQSWGLADASTAARATVAGPIGARHFAAESAAAKSKPQVYPYSDPSQAIAAAFKAAGLPVPEFPNAQPGTWAGFDPQSVIEAALKAAGRKP